MTSLQKRQKQLCRCYVRHILQNKPSHTILFGKGPLYTVEDSCVYLPPGWISE